MSNSETAKISPNPLAIPLQANNASSSSSTKSDLQRSSFFFFLYLNKRGNGSLFLYVKASPLSRSWRVSFKHDRGKPVTYGKAWRLRQGQGGRSVCQR